jgi:hypothetical protein
MLPRAVEVRREPVAEERENSASPEDKPSDERSPEGLSLDDLVLSYLTGGKDE